MPPTMSKLADQADHRLTKSRLPLRQASYVIGVRSITCVTLPIITLTSVGAAVVIGRPCLVIGRAPIAH
jgi:hypothetical protein